MSKRSLWVLLVLMIYFILSCLLTYPLIFNLQAQVWGGYCDSFGCIREIWWHNYAKRHSLSTNFTYLISSPFGIEIGDKITQPIYESILFFTASFTNEVVAYNLWVILGFTLSALSMYFLVFYLTGKKWPSFLSGFIFGFSPFAVLQSIGGHLGFSMNFWLPLYILFLFHLHKKRDYLIAILCGGSYALLTLTSLYYGYFMIFFTFCFIIIYQGFSFWKNGTSKLEILSIIKQWVVVIVIAISLILPFEWKAIFIWLTGQTQGEEGFRRSFGDLASYSARPWDYLLPSIDHPILGKYTINFVRNHLHGSNVPEQTLYLGFITLILVLVGVILVRKKIFVEEKKNIFLFFFLTAIVMAFLSAPPYIPLGKLKVPLTSFFLYKVAPMFRVYARFGGLVILCLAVLVGLTLSQLVDLLNKKKKEKVILLTIVTLLIIFEFWSASPFSAADISSPPVVYKWLAKQKGDFTIVEYPCVSSIDYNHYAYLFWQRLHLKRLVNGARISSEAEKIRKLIENIEEVQVPKILKHLGVKYIIIHTQRYIEGKIPGPIKRYYPPNVANEQYNNGRAPNLSGKFVLVKDFGSDKVYSIK